MTSRRELLKVGLAVSALPVVARAGLASGSAAAAVAPLYKVLYDTRFPASAAFARRAAARGLSVQSMEGDMTRFWYHDLYHRWRREPAPIAGLTGFGALFCLERLAWDQRMRVVFRGTHTVGPDGAVDHRFEGPPALLPAARTAVVAGSWAAALADVVAECPCGPAAMPHASATTLRAAAAPGAEEALYSWVIAPVSRA